MTNELNALMVETAAEFNKFTALTYTEENKPMTKAAALKARKCSKVIAENMKTFRKLSPK